MQPSLPTSVAPPVPRLHLAYLDGIRALAALYVVLFHIRLQLSGTFHGVRGVLFNMLRGGHFAVDIFIVLSGFCLALPVSRHGTMRDNAWTFYKKRARRILPPCYASVLVGIACAAALARLGQPHTPHVTVRALLANGLLLQDLFPALNIFNGVLWSVAVEWKIYFLFPMFVLLWQRRGIWTIPVTGAVLSVAAFMLLRSVFPGLILRYVCPWFIGLFSMGMCAALLASAPRGEKKSAPWGRMTLALACVLLAVHHLAPGDDDGSTSGHSLLWAADTAAGLTAASFLLWLNTAQTSVAQACVRALSARPLVRLGTFAYSLYLVHYPVLAVLARAVNHVHGLSSSTNAFALVLILIGLPLILTFAYGFFLLCERPFLNTGRQETLAEIARDTALSPAP